MSKLYHLEQLREDQIEEASRVLSRAFQEDPLFVYGYPDPNKRKVKSITYFEFLVLSGILYMDVSITSDETEGIAVWRPFQIRDQKIENPSKEIKRRMRKAKREALSDRQFHERYSIFSEILSNFENKHANFSHWELWIIGVDPIHQGKGYGSKLIRMRLAELDEQNLPCYLHNENERNIELYEHFGFEIVDHASIPNSNLKSWAMIRKEKKK